ncbi:MAG TPA: sigma-70 family RNA polymerase sigma factor, partial [Planctomycetota bacterium]|nr:sigma-70 family RNA polymerase sigma factor [Planctomycetota bacterium]
MLHSEMHDADFAPEGLIAHAGFVRQLARALVRDESIADDVAQETWRAALESPPRRGGPLRPWLATLARNFARRHWRGESRRSARERAAAREEATPSADARLQHAESLRVVVDAVLALPEPYRSALLLRYYEDLPPRAIAEREGIPVETVHTRLRRALARLLTFNVVCFGWIFFR